MLSLTRKAEILCTHKIYNNVLVPKIQIKKREAFGSLLFTMSKMSSLQGRRFKIGHIYSFTFPQLYKLWWLCYQKIVLETTNARE